MVESAPPQQIEIVLPLKPQNGARGSDLVRARDGLLASLNRFCDPGFVFRFSIVAPRADLPSLTGLQAASHLPIRLMAEEELLPYALPAMPRAGWYIQQMIKIAYAAICATPFYLTLDADSFLVAALDETLLVDGRAPAQYETVEAHPDWWIETASVLQARLSAIDDPAGMVFGVTPAFLSTRVMREVIVRLSTLAAGAGWPFYLAARTSSLDRTWTEYALYWTTLINFHDRDAIHYPRDTYAFCHSVNYARALIQPNHVRRERLFGVIQSSYVADAPCAAFVRRMLRQTEPAVDPRRKAGLNGLYHYIDPAKVASMLGRPRNWLVSAGVAGADMLARAIEAGADHALLGRYASPLPGHRGLRAVYLFDAPADIVLEQMRPGEQSGVCRNNNLNLVPALWDELTPESYAQGGEDLLNLIDHVAAWTDPGGPLRDCAYPVLMLRRSALARTVELLIRFLALSPRAAASVRRLVEGRDLPVAPEDAAMHAYLTALYAPLAARIAALPDAAVWQDGRLKVLA